MDRSELDIATRISERQMRLWGALHPYHPERAKNLPYRFLTISRDEGALGDELARTVADRAGWRLYDKEIVNDIARYYHVREEMVRRLDERPGDSAQGFISESILHLLSMPERPPFGFGDYHESLMRTLATIASRGAAVLVGRGANFVLRWSEHGLHLRVTGSFDVRVRRLSQERKMTTEAARKIISTVDDDRRAFIRRHFNQDSDDVRFYHLVINTDRLTVEQVSTAVLALLDPEGSLKKSLAA